MTGTLAIIGYGTLFQTASSDSPPVWTTLAEVRSLGLPTISRDVVDAGHECAPDEWREVLTGINNAGDISVEGNFIKTKYQLLLAEFGSKQIHTRRIVMPDNSIVTFDAYLTEIEVPVAVGDLVTTTAKFRASGAPSLTIA